jgi:hypothetical protein
LHLEVRQTRGKRGLGGAQRTHQQPHASAKSYRETATGHSDTEPFPGSTASTLFLKQNQQHPKLTPQNPRTPIYTHNRKDKAIPWQRPNP